MFGNKGHMKYNCRFFLLLLVAIIVSLSNYSDAQPAASGIYINDEFYQNFLKTPPIHRDDFFEMKLNSIIHSKGVVSSIDMEKRYRKNFRLILLDGDAHKMNLKITYFVFIDNKDTVSMLSKEMVFEFSGQLMAYTPLSSKRDEYILDVTLQKGAIVIE